LSDAEAGAIVQRLETMRNLPQKETYNASRRKVVALRTIKNFEKSKTGQLVTKFLNREKLSVNEIDFLIKYFKEVQSRQVKVEEGVGKNVEDLEKTWKTLEPSLQQLMLGDWKKVEWAKLRNLLTKVADWQKMNPSGRTARKQYFNLKMAGLKEQFDSIGLSANDPSLQALLKGDWANVNVATLHKAFTMAERSGATADAGQILIDAIGLIPGVGEIADASNAIISFKRGNYVDAGLSIISMIPLFGDAIGKGGKYAFKLLTNWGKIKGGLSHAIASVFGAPAAEGAIGEIEKQVARVKLHEDLAKEIENERKNKLVPPLQFQQIQAGTSGMEMEERIKFMENILSQHKNRGSVAKPGVPPSTTPATTT